MAICGRVIALQGGALLADGLGHSARSGRGRGRAATTEGVSGAGAASGAGHGGSGGSSLAVANFSSVVGGSAYGARLDGQPPGTLGSGGGGDGGGAGGGVIHVEATEALTFAQSSKLSARGGDGGDGDGIGGSGGGSGGSIAVRAGSVRASQGSGIVEAHGGAGGRPGGGGGAGGRVWLGPVGATWSAPPSRSVETIFGLPQGGMGGGGGDAGGAGALGGVRCAAGHGGLLCEPCPPGSAKAGQGDGPCDLCQVGLVAVGAGAHVCEPCPAGLVASTEAGGMAPTSGAGGVACLPCPVGQRAASSGTRCDECGLPPLHANFSAPNTCEWRCTSPFMLFGAAEAQSDGSRGCGLFSEVLFESIGLALGSATAGHALLLLPALLALCMLTVLRTLPAALRRRALAPPAVRTPPDTGDGRGGDGAATAVPLVTRANGAGADGASESPYGFEPLWRRHHVGGTSLNTALTWEAHKYRAKQHVMRVYLTGSNSPFAPWAMPVLPDELRTLVSEPIYYAFCETFREASRYEAWEVMVLILLVPLAPVALWFYHSRRKVHAHRLQQVVSALHGREGDESLWRSLSTRVWEGHRLEMHSGTLHHLGWIDVFSNVAAPLLPQAQQRRFTLTRITSHALTPSPENRSLLRTLSGRKHPLSRPDTETVAGAGQRNPRPPVLPCCLPRDDSLDSQSDGSMSRSASREGACESLNFWEHASRIDADGISADRAPHACGTDVGVLGLTRQQPARARSARRGRSRAQSPAQEEGTSAAHSSTPTRRPWSDALAHGPARVDPLAAASSQLDGRTDPLIHFRIYVCGAGTASRPYFLELADFLTFSALAAALDDNFEMLIAVFNTRLRQIDRYSAGYRQSLRAVAAIVETINRQLAQAAAEPRTPPTASAAQGPEGMAGAPRASPPPAMGVEGVRALGLVLLPNALPDKQLALFVGLGPPSRWSLPTGGVLLTTASCDSEATLPGFDTLLPPHARWLRSPPLSWARRLLLLPADHVSPLPRLAAATTWMLAMTQMLLLSISLSAVCAGSSAACIATQLLPPLALGFAPLTALWAALLVAAATLTSPPCSARGGRLPFRRRSVQSTGNMKQLMQRSDGPQGALARSDSLAGIVRSAMAYNSSSVLAMLVLLVAFALPQVRPLFSTVQCWVLPCALLATQTLQCLTLRELAAAAGMTKQMWALLVAMEAL